MNTPNPFRPPTTDVNAPAPVSAADVPPSVIAILGETRPWLRLMLGLFITGLVLFVGAMVALGLVGSYAGRRSAASLAGLAPLLLVGLLYAPPALYLARCAQAIRRLQAGGGLPALEDALRSQKSFWKYLGILVLVVIVVYGLALLALSTIRH